MNTPLSCHLGKHFAKKIGREWVCMYCDEVVPSIIDQLKPMLHTIQQLSIAKDIMLRNHKNNISD